MSELKENNRSLLKKLSEPLLLSPPSKRHPIDVLLIEDNPLDASTLLHVLDEFHGQFATRSCISWDQFQHELQISLPDIILSEFSVDKYSAFEAIHHLQKSGHRIPFILVTRPHSEEFAVQCMKEGADDYVLKSNLRRLPRAMLNTIDKNTHRRAKEELEIELHRQRDLYEALLAAQSESGIGYIIISGHSHSILQTNEAFCKISGYQSEELVALPSFLKLIHPDFVYRVEACIERKTSKEKNIDLSEITLLHKKGDHINVTITVRRPHKNDPRLIVIVQDITERVQHNARLNNALGALTENEERFRLLFEGVKDYAIFMLDPSGKIVNWNSGAERLYGYSNGEILGKNHSKFFQKNDAQIEKSKQALQTAMTTGRFEEEAWRVRKDGTEFWANAIITPVYNKDHTLIGFSTVIRDLTKTKQIEDQLREQGDYLRALAHKIEEAREDERFRIARELHDELGQVLTAFRMDLSILSNKITKLMDASKYKPLVEKIASMSRLLEQTIQSIRKIVAELRPTVLDELGIMTAIQWQAQEFENRTGIRCAILRLQRDVDVKPQQSTVLFRILQEALTNIAKHAKATNVNISFYKQNGNLVLIIRDNGIGINVGKELSKKSFGLTGMKERARILGGEVEILRLENDGTSVTVHIPINPGE